MQVDKNQIIELLNSRGDQDKATRADQDLPDTVDTDQDAGLRDTFLSKRNTLVCAGHDIGQQGEQQKPAEVAKGRAGERRARR